MDLKNRYITLVKNSLLDTIYGPEVCKIHTDGKTLIAYNNMVEDGTFWPERAYTIIGLKRMNNIEYCVNKILENKIPGDFIETGVWRGGACIFMRAILEANDITNRKVFVADSFSGFPPYNPKIESDKNKYQNYPQESYDFTSVSLNKVKDAFEKYNLLDKQVVFIEGYFQDTLPSNKDIGTLSLLRLDGDMYESTITVLNNLYDKVSVGGYIVIDDYALLPCRTAVHDFIEKQQLNIQIINIDNTGVYWIKNN